MRSEHVLQCVFTGKAQEVYSSMSATECMVYTKVKDAVLKAYELVAEAYRQRFRSWKKMGKQTYVEFARDLSLHFNRWCKAAAVETFPDLCDLILVEQFKQAIPDHIATYITERKVTTPNEAAVLADEYVLIHKRVFGERWYGEKSHSHDNKPQRVNVFPGVEPSFMQKGAWMGVTIVTGKKECPVLSGKGKSAQVKSAGLVAAVNKPVASSLGLVAPFDMKVQPSDTQDADLCYQIFISDGSVKLKGGDKEISVKILRDSGAMHTFVRETLLSFSPQADTGGCVPCRGLALQTLFVPVHKMFLSCGFFQKEVEVAVRPELPIRGVDIILGNDLVTDGRMWPDDVRPVLTPRVQDSVQIEQQQLPCPPASVPLVGAVTSPVSVHPQQTDFSCCSSSDPVAITSPDSSVVFGVRQGKKRSALGGVCCDSRYGYSVTRQWGN